MKRTLEFDKFRNIGIKSTQKLVLNHSLEKGKIGNLVIVVGANNSGKSNVLDALLEFSKQELSEKDVTTLSFADEDRIPKLTLKVKGDNEIYAYELERARSVPNIVYTDYNTYSFSQKKVALNELLAVIVEGFRESGMNDDVQAYQQAELLKKASQEDDLQPIISSISNIIDVIESRVGRYGTNCKILAERIRTFCASNGYLLTSLCQSKRASEIIQKRFLSNYGINFLPQIYPYTDKVLTNHDLETTPNQISGNQFFKAVFSAIKVDVAEINNAYADFNRLNSKAILSTLESKLNKKLKQVAKKFNDLYILEDGTYEFKISCESQKIYFMMFRNGQDIALNYQSAGFRWFFNLYFNLLCFNSLNAGDIVIMDEPATNLHVYGQQELRLFLKSFAKENDITIVLATHSPFLIDMDYLDELRVVSMSNNESEICNDFSTIDLDDPDSLSPIKEALTVRNHVLYDPDNKVVFVEGITDYNYMVAFKKRFQVENIVFLPIKGIGKYGSPQFKQKQQDISKRLIRIKKNSPILMVDSDNAGKSIKSINGMNSALQVFTLADVNPNFKAIESVFSQTDLKRLGIEVNGSIIKHSSTSALFKTFSFDTKLSAETESNFKSIFEYIENL